jgi:hypothetical protein
MKLDGKYFVSKYKS